MRCFCLQICLWIYFVLSIPGSGHTQTWQASDSPILLQETLLIPRTETLHIQPGVTVLFAASTGIVVSGTLVVEGTLEQPVLFQPRESGRTWGGIAVDRAAGAARIQYASFTSTSGLTYRGRNYPGAVTVNFSTASIEHCSFSFMNSIGVEANQSRLMVRNNRFANMGEGVHCNTCYAIVENNTFINILGYNDAIDFDYDLGPTSIIRNNVILGTEDDGIDLGFNSAIIEGNWIEGCADKGISAEGPSTPYIVNNVIRDLDLGIAVKDECDAMIVHNTIVDVNQGISLYEKNAGRGGGKAVVLNSVVWNTRTSVNVDAKSTLDMQNSCLMQLNPAWSETNISIEPQFEDAENRLLIPLPGSPLINAAVPTEVSLDYLGNPRPQGHAPDIGAYELNLETWIQEWTLY